MKEKQLKLPYDEALVFEAFSSRNWNEPTSQPTTLFNNFDSLAELIRLSLDKEDQVDGTTLRPNRHSTEPEQSKKGQETLCSQLVPRCPAKAKGLIQYHRSREYRSSGQDQGKIDAYSLRERRPKASMASSSIRSAADKIAISSPTTGVRTKGKSLD